MQTKITELYEITHPVAPAPWAGWPAERSSAVSNHSKNAAIFWSLDALPEYLLLEQGDQPVCKELESSG